jgi:hypothetical protein
MRAMRSGALWGISSPGSSAPYTLVQKASARVHDGRHFRLEIRGLISFTYFDSVVKTSCRMRDPAWV